MSVLASKREISKFEYAWHFVKLYEYTEEKLSKMAKRKYRWLAEPVVLRMNRIRDEIMQLYDEYYDPGISGREQCERFIRHLLDLQKPLLALWNIDRYTEKRMIKWASLIDREINLLTDMAGMGKCGQYMFILDYAAINRMDCMRNMSILHKMIYTKTISLPSRTRETKGSYLQKLADEALFRTFRANRTVPKSGREYEQRRADLSRAMNCIKSMEQPMFSIFNQMNYASETMEEIAKLITEQEKLLAGLMKSDRTRFSGLK